jgi:hypothetical protein
MLRLRLRVVFENLVTVVTSSFPHARQDATSYRGGGPMKKLLILAVLALTIIGGTAAIEMLVSYLAD